MTVFTIAFLLILTYAAWSDIQTGRIPNRCSVMILLVTLASVFAVGDISLLSRLTGAACVSVPMLLLAGLRDGAFGGGDIKLMAVSGAFLGWRGIAAAALIAVITGGPACIALLCAKKKTGKDRIIFGPFLCVGLAVSALWGERLLEWALL